MASAGVSAPDPYAAAPWRSSYPDSVPREPVVPDLPIGQLLDEVVARFGPLPAIACRQRTLTYVELRSRADRLSAVLHRSGVRPGDRVALVLPNTPEFVIAFFAILRLGAVVVPLNPLADPAELGDQLADSGAQVAICLDRAVAGVQGVRDRTPLREVLVTSVAEAYGSPSGLHHRLPWPGARERRALSVPVPKAPGVRRLLDAAREAPLGISRPTVDPDAAAVLTYTSGTTGSPRAAVLTHRNLIANGYQVGWWLPDVRPGREVTLAVLPLFHPFGLVLALQTTLLLGGMLVLIPGFDQIDVLAAFDRHHPTLFPGVPAMFRALLDNRDLRGYRTGALRAGICVGAQLPAVTAEAYERLTASVLVEGYGLAEAPLTHAVPTAGRRVAGTVGLPLPLTDARIVDPAAPTQLVPVGEIGELAIRGPQVSSRSWGGSGTPSADGYVLTGDLASMDAEGFFTVVGRIADALEVGGRYVSPADAEAVISALPQVARVGVVAGLGGPVAYVQLAPGESLSADAIVETCARVLPAEVAPVRVEFRETLALTGVGTVLRRALRAQEPVGSPSRPEAPPVAQPVRRAAATTTAPAKKTAAKKAAPTKTGSRTIATKSVGATSAGTRKVAAKKAAVKAAAPVKRARRTTQEDDDA